LILKKLILIESFIFSKGVGRKLQEERKREKGRRVWRERGGKKGGKEEEKEEGKKEGRSHSPMLPMIWGQVTFFHSFSLPICS
jgi:hypothetical protein